MENLMNVKTLPANATIFTGIGLMALARVFGMNPEFFAIGCGMMLLSASVGCLHQSTLVTGLRSHSIFSLGVFGLIALPLVVAAVTMPTGATVNSTLIGMLLASAASTVISMAIWSSVCWYRVRQSKAYAG